MEEQRVTLTDVDIPFGRMVILFEMDARIHTCRHTFVDRGWVDYACVQGRHWRLRHTHVPITGLKASTSSTCNTTLFDLT